jgi:sugar/nucleoside kinase (ribokinase family)
MSQACSAIPGVLCSGSIVYDILVRPAEEAPWGTTTFVDTIEYHVGGNGANTASALGRLGVPARLLGAVGGDAAGEFLLERIAKAGVDCSRVRHIAGSPTATSVALVGAAGQRRFLHRPGASASAFLSPIEFDARTIAGCRHYHQASFFVLPGFRAHAAECLRRARAAGLSTSFDANWDPSGRWMADLAPSLPYLDYVFVNEDEALMLTGESGPDAAAHILRSGGAKVVVIKRGGAGCSVFDPDGSTHCPAFDVPVVDTTGAGDCFVAGFLAALLGGASYQQAGLLANAVAALTVQRVGGVSGAPSLSEVEAWIRTAPRRP